MKSLLLRLLAATTVLCTALATRAQVPPGEVAARFALSAGKLLTDPTRDRVYALLPEANGVAVINTATRSLTTTIPVGSNPGDLAISRDGGTLYVANRGTNLLAVSVIDLNKLTLTTSFSLPGAPVAIAAGLGGRLYVSGTTGDSQSVIYQIDGTTGATQTTFNGGFYSNDLLTVSPDGKTLFVANNGEEPGTLQSFDVSTATPGVLQTNGDASVFPTVLAVSHNGKYLCLPGGSGNPGISYGTLLFSTADINSYYGGFQNGAYPGALTFSPDDSLVYQVLDDSGTLQIFSTTTFAQVGRFSLPSVGDNAALDLFPSVATDRTGSYLLVGANDDYDTGTVGQLSFLTTGLGTLTPSTALPVVTGPTSVFAPLGQAFAFQVSATGHPTSYAATGLPAGLAINSTTGLITGTPTGSATSYAAVVLTVANAIGTATANFQIQVGHAGGTTAPVITTASLPYGVLGQAYHATLASSESNVTWSATGLPAGLSIGTTTGVISGTPTLFGSSLITVTTTSNTDEYSGSAVFVLGVLPAAPVYPVITSATGVAGAVGKAFTYQIAATNSPTSYAATGLPKGLTIDQKTGVISGVPSVAGTYSVTLSAINTKGTGTTTLGLIITDQIPDAPVVDSATVTATVGTAFSYQITATNSPYRYAVSGDLPEGLAEDETTGLITGTPQEGGTFNLILSATNAGGTGAAKLTLTIPLPVPVITNTVLSGSVTAGQEFNLVITATNDPFYIAALGLPDGITVNPTTGLLTGTPTVPGVYNLTLQAQNAYGTGTKAFALTVNPALPVVDIAATVPRVTAGSGEDGEITITRTGDTSSLLIVYYTLAGNAQNGTDYERISPRKKKIKPGRSSAVISIVPEGTLAGETTRKLKVTLQVADAYQLGDTIKAKVKIVPGE